MNSDMSMRIRCSSESNMNSASALHSSVLPTPVGPRNRNEPYGRCGSPRPARERRMASDTSRTASSWPTTRPCSRPSIFNTFSPSPRPIFATGLPVAPRRFRLLQLRFQLRQLAVLQLGDLVELAGALQLDDLGAHALDFFLDVCAALHLCFLGFPDVIAIGIFPLP